MCPSTRAIHLCILDVVKSIIIFVAQFPQFAKTIFHSSSHELSVRRMSTEPFDPDDTRYRHLGCCDAHVAVRVIFYILSCFFYLQIKNLFQTSARLVVAASLVALLFKTIASANMGEWAYTLVRLLKYFII